MFDISASAEVYISPPCGLCLKCGEPSRRPPINCAPSCVTCIIQRIRAPPSTGKCTEKAEPPPQRARRVGGAEVGELPHRFDLLRRKLQRREGGRPHLRRSLQPRRRFRQLVQAA